MEWSEWSAREVRRFSGDAQNARMTTTGPGWKHFARLGTFAFCLFSFAFAALAQDAPPVLTAPPGFDFTGWLLSFAASNPKLASLFLVMGALRACLKPVSLFLHEVVKLTPSDRDDALVARMESSPVVKWLVHALDYFASIKLVNPRAVLLALLLPALLTTPGCATWDGLSPNQQAVIKAAAKLAVSFGVSQLGDSVKELRPYQDALMGVINATFSATDNAASLGAALNEGVTTVVQDPVLRAQVMAAIKSQLAGATAGAGSQKPGARSQEKFNAAIASRL